MLLDGTLWGMWLGGHSLLISTTPHSQHCLFQHKLYCHQVHAKSLKLSHLFSNALIGASPSCIIHALNCFYVEFNFVVLEWITIYLELAFQAILSNVLPSFEAWRFWARFAYLHMMGAWTRWSFDPNSKLVHPSQ